MLAPRLRIYLTGNVCLEAGESLLEERQLPRRQGRLALAILALEHARPISRDELADFLWPDQPPDAWDVALRALISKLRTALRSFGWPYAEPVEAAFGAYQLRLPPSTWIDIEVAQASVHRAEALLERGEMRAAYSWAIVTSTISRRQFLAGDEGPWVDNTRERLHGYLVRALDCLVTVCAAVGEHSLAQKNAAEAVALEPLRETGYVKLMRLQASIGNRAEALQTYRRCSEVLGSELGIAPNDETRAALEAILGTASRSDTVSPGGSRRGE
jgi:DNA-binding SARP family transcriptional activator